MKSYEKAHPHAEKLVFLYTSIPGVGKVTALQLIVDLLKLLTANDKTLAALFAARCNPTLKPFYSKLKAKGKASKVALIAVAHKLLFILRSIAQRQTPWVQVIER